MKAAKFDLQVASTLTQAASHLLADPFETKLIAGSQSLGPMLNLRLTRPARLVDISALGELRTVTNDNHSLRIGAGVTHAEIEDGVYSALRDHPWRKVAGTIAYRSVRNRGTIGGSLAHADPAADWVLAATAMSAEVEIVKIDSADGLLTARTLPMQQFMTAAYTTALESEEIIHAIIVPTSSINARWGYYKFCRKVGEFAHASCAVYFDDESATANISIGALNGPPRLLRTLATDIANSAWGKAPAEQQQASVRQAIAEAIPERDPIDQKMYTTAVLRALDKAFNSGVANG